MISEVCSVSARKPFIAPLSLQILPFANAFYRGLSDLISPSWLSLFNANEFNQVILFSFLSFFFQGEDSPLYFWMLRNWSSLLYCGK